MTASNRVIEILLAEDNEDDILIIKDAFEDKKMVNIVDVVKNGKELLSYLRKDPPFEKKRLPGLILLDINMPIMNGLEALDQIKSDPNLSHVPVIVLTTSSQEKDIIKSYASGACSYISKPVDFDEFDKVINQFELYWALVARIPN